MKKIIFSLLITAITPLAFAQENSGYCYGTSQMVGGNPMVGIGMRGRSEHQGVDFSASVLPTNRFDPMIFHTKAQYLYYPMKKNGIYLAGGLGFLNEPETIKGTTASIEPGIGYEWKASKSARIFIEANGIVPVKKPEGANRIWPGISVGVGF